jgi:hypothetical protein
MAVSLWEWFEFKTRKSQPGGLNLGCFPKGYIQSANREKVGGWTEVEVQIDAAHYFGLLNSIKPPAS